jgi:hypothetical protein
MLISPLRLLFPLIADDIIVWSSDRRIISASGERQSEGDNEEKEHIQIVFDRERIQSLMGKRRCRNRTKINRFFMVLSV